MSKFLTVDEIDALLSERRSGEHEAVRRIKTEFLLQFEGMMTGNREHVAVYRWSSSSLLKIAKFCCIFFGGLECVVHSFANVAHLLVLRDSNPSATVAI
jgi:hypothetical protein